MHEWSLAEALISKIEEVSSGRTPLHAKVSIGELMEIEVDVLKEALNVLAKERGMDRLTFTINVEETSFKCNSCGLEWKWKEVAKRMAKELEPYQIIDEGEPTTPFHFLPYLAHAILKCPKCGSRDFEIKSGNTAKLLSVVVEE